MEAITISPFAFTKKRWDQSTSCEMGAKHTECDTICKDTTYVNISLHTCICINNCYDHILLLELGVCSISAINESYTCYRNFYTLKK